MKLSPGDMVYYAPNDALGVLLRRVAKGEGYVWEYSLRSPLRSNMRKILVSLVEAPEENFINSIDIGSLQLFRKERQ